jgi:hypothetical protein
VVVGGLLGSLLTQCGFFLHATDFLLLLAVLGYQVACSQELKAAEDHHVLSLLSSQNGTIWLLVRSRQAKGEGWWREEWEMGR